MTGHPVRRVSREGRKGCIARQFFTDDLIAFDKSPAFRLTGCGNDWWEASKGAFGASRTNRQEEKPKCREEVNVPSVLSGRTNDGQSSAEDLLLPKVAASSSLRNGLLACRQIYQFFLLN